jgi:hypothetical protein
VVTVILTRFVPPSLSPFMVDFSDFSMGSSAGHDVDEVGARSTV